MGRPEASIDPAEGPLQRFACELRTIRRRAGSPSYGSLASRANYSGTTLAAAARGIHMPSLEVTVAYVSACNADPQPWVGYWHRTRGALLTRQPGLTVPRPSHPYRGIHSSVAAIAAA